MGKRVALNEKRLTKKQVQELIANGATLREDLMADLRKTRPEHDLLYELQDGNILWVLDPNGFHLQGRGDIWPQEEVHRHVRFSNQIKEDAIAGRQCSADCWRYYSAYKERLPDHVVQLVSELPAKLGVEEAKLDFTYVSLDILSARIDEIGETRVRETAFDHLVAYVGELMRRRVNGAWVIETRQGDPFPYVLSAVSGKLMPINVVAGELMGLKPNLRSETADEVRRAQWDGRIRQSLGIPP